MFSTLFFGITAFLGTFWTLPFLFLIFTPAKLFLITTKEHVTKIRTKFLKTASINIDNERGSGFFFSRHYFGYIKEQSSARSITYSVYLLTTEFYYLKLIENGSESGAKNNTKTISTMTIWERSGHYFHLSYGKRKLQFPFDPRQNQIETIDTIKQLYEEKGHCSIFLHGPSGSGKSMIGRFISKDYGGHYCDTWCPTDPGDQLSSLYNSVLPNKKNPLILVLDEFDGILMGIHTKSIEKHKYIPIPIIDKTTWNQFLDRFHLGTYPNVILMLISNRSLEWANELDPSYLRPGRVDMIFKIE